MRYLNESVTKKVSLTKKRTGLIKIHAFLKRTHEKIVSVTIT